MFCKNCGTQLPDDSKFCPKCGSKIEQNENTQQPQPIQPFAQDKMMTQTPIEQQKKKKNGLIIGIIIGVIILLVIVVAVAVKISSSNDDYTYDFSDQVQATETTNSEESADSASISKMENYCASYNGKKLVPGKIKVQDFIDDGWLFDEYFNPNEELNGKTYTYTYDYVKKGNAVFTDFEYVNPNETPMLNKDCYLYKYGFILNYSPSEFDGTVVETTNIDYDAFELPLGIKRDMTAAELENHLKSIGVEYTRQDYPSESEGASVYFDIRFNQLSISISVKNDIDRITDISFGFNSFTALSFFN